MNEEALDAACRAWAKADPTVPRELSSYSYLGLMTLRGRMREALAAAEPIITEDAWDAAHAHYREADS